MTIVTDEQRQQWREEYEKNPAAQEDFVEAGDFVAFMVVAAKRHPDAYGDFLQKKQGDAKPRRVASEDEGFRAEWDRDAKLRAEFADMFDVYTALKRNEHKIKILES